MNRYSVTGTATRLVRETVEFSVEVQAYNLAGVEAATRTALVNGDYEIDDTSDETVVGTPELVTLGETENLGAVYVAAPRAVPTPAPAPTGYAAAGRGQQGNGFAVANVEPRANGYVPVRVAHRAAR
jgi:hypothetical protein